MNILLQAGDIVKKKWRTTGIVAKVFLAIAIVVVCVVGLVCFIIWSVARLLKSLSVGGTRNMGLYFPSPRRRSR